MQRVLTGRSHWRRPRFHIVQGFITRTVTTALWETLRDHADIIHFMVFLGHDEHLIDPVCQKDQVFHLVTLVEPLRLNLESPRPSIRHCR